MGEAREAPPAQLFVGLLIAPQCPLARVQELLEERLGPVEIRSQLLDFIYTKYYEPEMGPDLKRQFLGFQNLVVPHQLPEVKHFTNGLERDFAPQGKRCINIDPGYLTGAKLVLASTKDYAHRLYLGNGIYGEVTLIFQRGEFTPLPWTYPDYRSDAYQPFFRELRDRYLARVSRKPPVSKDL